jgi:hypothetical protein
MTDHMEAAYMLPIHWSTFIQSDEPTDEPMQRLVAAANGQEHRIALRRVGETWRKT